MQTVGRVRLVDNHGCGPAICTFLSVALRECDSPEFGKEVGRVWRGRRGNIVAERSRWAVTLFRVLGQLARGQSRSPLLRAVPWVKHLQNALDAGEDAGL